MSINEARMALAGALAPRNEIEMRVLVEALDVFAERNDRATLVHVGVNDATAAIRRRVADVMNSEGGGQLRRALLGE